MYGNDILKGSEPNMIHKGTNSLHKIENSHWKASKMNIHNSVIVTGNMGSVQGLLWSG